MYLAMRGVVRQYNNKHLLLDVNNYSYELRIINSAPVVMKEKDHLELYPCLINNDYLTNQWYGFLDLSTKRLFLDLLKIPTVGVKTAIAILEHFNVAEFLTTIKENDISQFEQIKGVKLPTARLIIQYCAKLYFKKTFNNDQNNIIFCLQQLGYQTALIYQALREVPYHENLTLYFKLLLQKLGNYYHGK